MNTSDYILIIGGSNIDITGFSENPIIMEDSNPGKVKISAGGVGRNIAENMAKLGANIKLLSVFGDDPYSNYLKDNCSENNIDISESLTITNSLSPVYLSIINNDGDMKLALCDASILDSLDIDYIKSKDSLIQGAKLILLDTNISTEVIEYVCNNYSHIPIFTDGVSTQKSLKLKNVLNNIHTLKLNRIEAQTLSGLKDNYVSYTTLVNYFVSRGVKNVYITLGGDGVFYGNKDMTIQKASPKVEVVNATGAGDAFMTGIIYGHFNNYDLNKIIVTGIAASVLALSHENTINPNMSINNINNIIKELGIC